MGQTEPAFNATVGFGEYLIRVHWMVESSGEPMSVILP